LYATAGDGTVLGQPAADEALPAPVEEFPDQDGQRRRQEGGSHKFGVGDGD
jgi:hypothetical protein